MPDIRLAILLVTYLLIALREVPRIRLNRPAAALVGAVAMVTIGGIPLREAYAAIDGDVLVFLLGVLLLTGYLEIGGFFEWAAARLVERARSPRALLALVVAASGILSALFVNDTVCLVLTPLVLAALAPLGLRPLPYLLAIALASNVGSVMTPTGNPQNMLVAVAGHLSFAGFAGALALPALGGLVIVYGVLAVRFRGELAAPLAVSRPRLEPVTDRVLVTKTLIVFGGALAAWLAGASLPLVAITAGAVLLAIGNRDPARAFTHVEWELLLFFGALFVVMRGVRDIPLVLSLTAHTKAGLHAGPWREAVGVSAAMVALSNLVSNVPAVLLWLPIVPGARDPGFVWLVVALSATLAGNLTLLGSMANLIVAERAESRGVRVGFFEYLVVGVPVTVLTLVWGVAVLVWLRG